LERLLELADVLHLQLLLLLFGQLRELDVNHVILIKVFQSLDCGVSAVVQARRLRLHEIRLEVVVLRTFVPNLEGIQEHQGRVLQAVIGAKALLVLF